MTPEEKQAWEAKPCWYAEPSDWRKGRIDLVRKGIDPPWSKEPFADFGTQYGLTVAEAEALRDSLTRAIEEARTCKPGLQVEEEG